MQDQPIRTPTDEARHKDRAILNLLVDPVELWSIEELSPRDRRRPQQRDRQPRPPLRSRPGSSLRQVRLRDQGGKGLLRTHGGVRVVQSGTTRCASAGRGSSRTCRNTFRRATQLSLVPQVHHFYLVDILAQEA